MIRFRSEELACRCREYLSECVWLMVLLDALLRDLDGQGRGWLSEPRFYC